MILYVISIVIGLLVLVYASDLFNIGRTNRR
jgi:hypothetical protein